MPHWIDNIVKSIARRCEELGKSECVINGGLSVSGLQHVGRLRGEVVINNVIAERLRDEYGLRVRQFLTLYTMDPWKGKERQIEQFSDRGEALKLVGQPLERIPDPRGCHRSWVEHYWEDFGNYLSYFVRDEVNVITTGHLYRNSDKMREFIKLTLSRRMKVIEVLNKYRARNPYPQDYIPYEPVCRSCGRVGASKVLDVDVDRNYVYYKCKCGYEGSGDLSDGKLPWRIEWVAVWYCLSVDFEPYGKDHATPGGSRDSAVDLAMNVYNIRPPLGIWYEWVGYVRCGKDVGDMGSSDFIGFTPREWIEVAETEVLRYIYIFHEPQRRIALSLESVHQYVDSYDRAERIYYGVDRPSPRELPYLELMIKSYEYAQIVKPLPKEPPFQIPYLHAVALVQTLPRTDRLDELVELSIKRLSETKMLSRELDEISLRKLRTRLLNAINWVNKYAPESYRIRVIDDVTEDIVKEIDVSVLPKLKVLLDRLRSAEPWDEDVIKNVMKSIPKENKIVEREFFRAIYLSFFGKESGPRIAPYLAVLGKDFVVDRLSRVIKLLSSVSR